jgi:hypothetical protein
LPFAEHLLDRVELELFQQPLRLDDTWVDRVNVVNCGDDLSQRRWPTRDFAGL